MFVLRLVCVAILYVSCVSNVFAVGRLNFMLTNNTDVGVTDVRIYPTAYPEYISKNLLSRTLDSNFRVYIGPNYYSGEKLWSIKITFDDGREQIFNDNKLTRYNSYTLYNKKQTDSFGLKQTFNKDFDRKNVKLKNISYGNKESTGDVLVSEPESVTQKEQSELKNKQVIQFEISAEVNRGGKVFETLPTEVFRSGDKLRLKFTAGVDGFIYWIAKGSSGQYQLLYPNVKNPDNRILKGENYTMPYKGFWRFDNNKGQEHLIGIVSVERNLFLDELVGKKLSEREVNGINKLLNLHEQKRHTRDLVFEEENDDSKEIISQSSEEGENLIINIDLIHE